MSSQFLSNALKYTRRRHVTVPQDAGNEIFFPLRHGRGFPLSISQYLEQFFRVPDQEKNRERPGLAIVKEIIEAHGDRRRGSRKGREHLYVYFENGRSTGAEGGWFMNDLIMFNNHRFFRPVYSVPAGL